MGLTRRGFLCKSFWAAFVALVGVRIVDLDKVVRDIADRVLVRYDARTNTIIVSGGSEEHPITMQHIYDAAEAGLIPASVVGDDGRMMIGRGMTLQAGMPGKHTYIEFGNLRGHCGPQTPARDIFPNHSALDGPGVLDS